MQNHLATRTSLGLYRESLRMAKIVAAQNGNYGTLRKHVKRQFEAHRGLVDKAEIEQARGIAIAGISNYMLMRASQLVEPEAHERNIFEEAKREPKDDTEDQERPFK